MSDRSRHLNQTHCHCVYDYQTHLLPIKSIKNAQLSADDNITVVWQWRGCAFRWATAAAAAGQKAVVWMCVIDSMQCRHTNDNGVSALSVRAGQTNGRTDKGRNRLICKRNYTFWHTSRTHAQTHTIITAENCSLICTLFKPRPACPPRIELSIENYTINSRSVNGTGALPPHSHLLGIKNTESLKNRLLSRYSRPYRVWL